MRNRRTILISIAVVGALGAWWITSEVNYAKSISPLGMARMADFLQRFGDPSLVMEVQQGGQPFYELSWPLPSRWSLALPSNTPAYIFDTDGRFVTWCKDPGDDPGHRQRWPLASTTPADMQDIKRYYKDQ